MKIYIINWGFYSPNDGATEIAAIYSTYELAIEHILQESKDRNLKQEKNKKTNKLRECWTDGDYWISVGVGYMDSPVLYISKEEWERIRENDRT